MPLNTIPRARIFISSPGDVAEERAAARTVIERLKTDPLLRGEIVLEAVAWDDPESSTPLLATLTPQQAINRGLARPSECDIVIVIFWARMGTPLTVETLKPDGTQYLSGTEWEYLDAVQAPRADPGDPPLVVLYRRQGGFDVNFKDPEFAAKYEQWRRVEAFFAGFINPDGSLRQGHNPYATPDEFARLLEQHLKNLLKQLINAHRAREAAERQAREAAEQAARDAADRAERDRQQAAGAPPRPQSLPEPVRDLAPSADLWPGSPFPGLRAFTPADERIYYGRGAETDALVERLRGARTIAIVGASGSGKSSLVGAGLIPRLKANAIDGAKDWLLPDFAAGAWTGVRFTPGELGDNPFMALALDLAPLTGTEARPLAAALAADPASIAGSIEAALRGRSAWAELLIFIDQFEELFTLCAASHRAPFAALIEAAVAGGRARVVMTMRADFYGRAIEVPVLEGLLKAGTFPLGKPNQVALNEMIVKPADAAGLAFQPGLPEILLDDTGDDPGALALLAYALDQLYASGGLTRDNYDDIGGVQGAIGARAEAVYAGLPAQAQAALAPAFTQLVEVDERGEPTRRRAAWAAAAAHPGADALLTALTDARLLVTGRVGAEATVEVAHEALLRSWERLRRWIAEQAANLALRRRLEGEARAWAAAPEAMRGEFVLLGGRLLEAERWAEAMAAPAGVAAFIRASRAAETERLAAEAQRQSELEQAAERARLASIAAIILLVAGVVAGILAVNQTNLANEQTNRANTQATNVNQRIAELADISPGATQGARWTQWQENLPPAGWVSPTMPIYNNEDWTVSIEVFDGVEMVEVPAGCFLMGSDDGASNEQPVHQQCFEAPFYIDRTEVTQGQFARLGGVKARDNGFSGDNLPVERITWYEARDFCARRGARLPTEAEWEYAARGPEGLAYPWGNDFVGDNAVYRENSGDRTAPVGSRPGASWVGAFDMSGNVWEWVSSASQPYPYSADDGREIMNNEQLRVVRGGSFNSSSNYLRAANRNGRNPTIVNCNIGFRCALSR